MRFFFRSRKFKVIAVITALLISFTIVAKLLGGSAAPTASVIGAIVAPIQHFAAWVSDGFNDLGNRLGDNQDLMQEIEGLKEENNKLTNDLINYNEVIKENEFYKQFLEIKEKNKDFLMESATRISRDPTDPYLGFTINRGLLDGIAVGDPVITSDGLVGFIGETAPSYSKVITILNGDINIGAMDSRTSDSGAVSGNFTLAKQGRCKFYNLPRTSAVTIGNRVLTSGGGLFPKGLLIGTVLDIKPEEINTSIYAIIEPAANIAEVKDVMVLTYFSGQGNDLEKNNK
ncbi:MAG: rod shape-determining protein MreC [Oscillospiraceae bacterium]